MSVNSETKISAHVLDNMPVVNVVTNLTIEQMKDKNIQTLWNVVCGDKIISFPLNFYIGRCGNLGNGAAFKIK